MSWLIKKSSQSDVPLKAVLLVVFMLVCGGTYAVYSIVRKGDHRPISMNSEINGTFDNYFMDRAFLYLQLEDEPIKWQVRDAYNPDYGLKHLSNILEKGALVYKKAESDTLYVQKDDREFYFVLKFYDK